MEVGFVGGVVMWIVTQPIRCHEKREVRCEV
jgi:hypothetical protein